MENMIENIDGHFPRAEIRQMALLTKIVHWRILMVNIVENYSQSLAFLIDRMIER